MDVTDVEASAAVDAGPAAHQFFKQNIITEGDIEDTMDGEKFEVGIELSLGSGEAIEDDSLG